MEHKLAGRSFLISPEIVDFELMSRKHGRIRCCLIFFWVLLLDSLFESSPNYLCPNNLLFNFRFCFWAVIETQSTWATKNIVRSEKNMQSYMHI